MKIGLGIDTGGTYTDGVIYDLDKKEILASGKELTTKEDLVIGIKKVIEQFPRALSSQVSLVSLSTTLATNAAVEGIKAKSGLIFIGGNPKTVAEMGAKYGLPPVDEILFVESKGNIEGDTLQEPDWIAMKVSVEAWMQHVDSIAIVELYAMTNGGVLEKKAKEIIREMTSKSIICGHEIFMDLNSLQRAASALLNAGLVPVIKNFLEAVREALTMNGIDAPIVIVRSDGSVMTESFAKDNPIETILCGPAAGVIGGMNLTPEKDMIVVDMGGTTTDIAIVKNRRPVEALEGVKVGEWRTCVKGLYIDTFGLGGDSGISFDGGCDIRLEKVRKIPLCMLATRYPEVKEQLDQVLSMYSRHTLPMHEFLVMVKPLSLDESYYTSLEKRVCELLKDGPMNSVVLAKKLNIDIYELRVKRLEEQGNIIRSGLTPTDIMHIKRDFNEYDQEASYKGATFIANCIQETVEELCERVYNCIKAKLYKHIVTILLKDQGLVDRHKELPIDLENLIAYSWKNHKSDNPFISTAFQTKAQLVGIGAPTHLFLEEVAQALGSHMVYANYSHVGNAVGAIAGQVSFRSKVRVQNGSGEKYGVYTVYSANEVLRCGDLDEAIRLAKQQAEKEVIEKISQQGIYEDLEIQVGEVVCEANTELGSSIHLYTDIVATASSKHY